MSEGKDFMQKAALLSASVLLQELLKESKKIKDRFDQLFEVITPDNILKYEGSIYSVCICEDKAKLDRLVMLFDNQRDLLNLEKPQEEFKENLFNEMTRQINLIRLDFVNSNYVEIIKIQREVIKHLRALDTTIPDGLLKEDKERMKKGKKEKKKEEEDDLF